jgi:large subunit ribosomal protein L24
MKIRKGDTVLVISGPDKGAKGRVIEAYPARDKVLVEGVNRIKKHVANSAPERGAESEWHRHPGSPHPRVQRDGPGRRR